MPCGPICQSNLNHAKKTLDKSEEIAKQYGDVAGTKAAIEYEEQKTAKARVVALHALWNEVARIRAVAIQNHALDPRGRHQNAIRMPVAAFETAFLSKESVLLEKWQKESEFFADAKQYLLEAYFVNAQIDFFLSASGALANPLASEMMVHMTSQIVDRSKEVVKILTRLEEHLERELDKQTKALEVQQF